MGGRVAVLPLDFGRAGGWWNRFPLCAPPGHCVNPGRRILEVNELFKREKEKKGEEEEQAGAAAARALPLKACSGNGLRPLPGATAEDALPRPAGHRAPQAGSESTSRGTARLSAGSAGESAAAAALERVSGALPPRRRLPSWGRRGGWERLGGGALASGLPEAEPGCHSGEPGRRV